MFQLIVNGEEDAPQLKLTWKGIGAIMSGLLSVLMAIGVVGWGLMWKVDLIRDLVEVNTRDRWHMLDDRSYMQEFTRVNSLRWVDHHRVTTSRADGKQP